MRVTIDITDSEKIEVIAYAKKHRISVEKAFKQALFEKIEDEINLKMAEKSYEEYLKNLASYSIDEIMRD